MVCGEESDTGVEVLKDYWVGSAMNNTCKNLRQLLTILLNNYTTCTHEIPTSPKRAKQDRKLLTNRRSMFERVVRNPMIDAPPERQRRIQFFCLFISIFIKKTLLTINKTCTYQERRQLVHGIGCGGDQLSHSDQAPWT